MGLIFWMITKNVPTGDVRQWTDGRCVVLGLLADSATGVECTKRGSGKNRPTVCREVTRFRVVYDVALDDNSNSNNNNNSSFAAFDSNYGVWTTDMPILLVAGVADARRCLIPILLSDRVSALSVYEDKLELGDSRVAILDHTIDELVTAQWKRNASAISWGVLWGLVPVTIVIAMLYMSECDCCRDCCEDCFRRRSVPIQAPLPPQKKAVEMQSNFILHLDPFH